jgi:molecular chaperone GrpE
MSFSDETTPEEVAPEPPEKDAGETWSDADSAAVDAEVQSAAPLASLASVDGDGQGDGGAEGAEGEAAAPLDPLAAMTAARDEYLLALQRTQADFENYRKRITRLQQEQSARASADIVAKLLPVLDTLDLAQAHRGEADADSEDAKALTASRSMLLDLLAKEGLERVDEAEVPFDPAIHDAVARSEGESDEVVIDEILRSGYRWKGQVLRPAMVRVRG